MKTPSAQWPVLATAVLLCLGNLPANAQDKPQDSAMADMTMANPADLKWVDAPPGLPKGVKLAVLYGDPGKDGPYVIRLKAPGGYKVPPHWHTQTENLTVISGTLYLGSGDTMDMGAAHALKPAGSTTCPEACTTTPSRRRRPWCRFMAQGRWM